MAGKGGYQRPTSPAPVSGPGALSQRTDGGPGSQQAARYVSGLPYGEGQQMMNLQASAPMEAAGTPAAPASSFAPTQGASAPLVPLTAPSQNLGEPVTAGANSGAGPDMSALGLGSGDKAADGQFAASIASYMPVLMYVASQPNTSAETRRVIMQLRDQM
jgi:hypothetical protein